MREGVLSALNQILKFIGEAKYESEMTLIEGEIQWSLAEKVYIGDYSHIEMLLNVIYEISFEEMTWVFPMRWDQMGFSEPFEKLKDNSDNLMSASFNSSFD